MRPEETRTIVEAQRARAYEAYSEYAAVEKINTLHAKIDRPLGTAAIGHSAIDDLTLLAQSFVMPGFGIRPETPVLEREPRVFPDELHARHFGAAALSNIHLMPEAPTATPAELAEQAMSRTAYTLAS